MSDGLWAFYGHMDRRWDADPCAPVDYYDQAAVHRHGPLRAAQAVVAAAEMCRVREGSADPPQHPAAYLGGMLRRPGGQLRPDLTLGRIEARSQYQREKENER